MKPRRPRSVELIPDELGRRIVWDDAYLAGELENRRRAASNMKHLAENRLRTPMRGGAQSTATKAFRMHPRVWSLLEPPAKQEIYHRYAKIEHDSRNEVSDWVEPGTYRVMLRMNPQIQKHVDRFQIPYRLKPAVLEIHKLVEYLQQLGEFDESLKQALCSSIEASFDGSLLHEGKNVMASPPLETNLKARLDTITQMKREVMSCLECLPTQPMGNGESPADKPSSEFLRSAAVQQVQCFLGAALLESSKPFSASGLKQAP